PHPRGEARDVVRPALHRVDDPQRDLGAHRVIGRPRHGGERALRPVRTNDDHDGSPSAGLPQRSRPSRRTGFNPRLRVPAGRTGESGPVTRPAGRRAGPFPSPSAAGTGVVSTVAAGDRPRRRPKTPIGEASALGVARRPARRRPCRSVLFRGPSPHPVAGRRVMGWLRAGGATAISVPRRSRRPPARLFGPPTGHGPDGRYRALAGPAGSRESEGSEGG